MLFLAGGIFAQCANSPPRPIDTYPSGLVNYWNFDKNYSITYGANTAVPNATAPSSVCGQVGGAYQFNGANQSFDITRTIQDDMSILYLTKTSMTGGTGTDYWQDTGIVDGEFNGGTADFGAVLQGSHYAWGTNDGQTVAGTVTVNNNVYHCFAGTRVRSTGTMVLYTDGAFDASRTGLSTANLTQPPNLRIGGTRTGNTAYNPKPWFNGTIDEVVLMSRAITAAEALQFCQFAQSGFTYFATRPTLTFTGTSLLGSAAFTDPDGNRINYSYSLYLNGTRVFTGNSTSVNNLPGAWVNMTDYLNISTGNWTIEVWGTDGMASSAKINSTSLVITVPAFNLSGFTSSDPQGGNITASPDTQVIFYANATMPPNGTALSGANCTIKYHDNSTAIMSYNSTSKLFQSNRSYSYSGNYSYNITCTYGLTTRTVAGTVPVFGFGLAAWDSNDPQGGGQTIYPGGTALFYSNFTYPNGTAVPGGSCNITYHDNTTAAMSYNATSRLYQSSRPYSLAGNYTYNVTCSFGANVVSFPGSITISYYGCPNMPPRPIDTYPSGLVSYWNLDLSANSTYGGYDGTVIDSPALGCTKVGGGYSFSSSSANFINTSLLQNAVSQYSIAALVKTPSAQGVVVNDRGSGPGLSLTLTIGPACGVGYGTYCPSSSAGVPSFGIDSNGIWIGQNGLASIADNTWHSLFGVFNSTSGQSLSAANLGIYVDGLLSSGPTGAIGSAASPLTGLSGTRIGYHEPWAHYFNGTIDEVAIFTRALTSSEISQFYNFTQSNFSYFATRPNITFNGTALLGSAAFIDPEGSVLNYSYSWYLDGVKVNTGNSTSINNPSGSWELLSAYPNESTGNWTFEVWATDGQLWSAPINSTPLFITVPKLYVSTDKASYNSCATIFYRATTTDINDLPVDVATNVSIFDPFLSQKYFNMFSSGNMGAGFYVGQYNISSGDPTGAWSIRAATCGNFKANGLTVN